MSGFTLAPMRGRAPKKHDCGQHGWLTAQQIAAKAGLSAETIRARVRAGITGEDLCGGRRRRGGHHGPFYTDGVIHGNVHQQIFVACRIAQSFRGAPPTVDGLRSRFGMSRATAYRWRRAWREAMGQIA